MSGILQTASGFTFEYENLFGEGKVTAGEIEAIRGKIDQAHAAIEHMRATGEVQGHLSKDGAPEKVLFTQLPYIAPGHLNSPESIDRLKKFGASLLFTGCRHDNSSLYPPPSKASGLPLAS